MTKRHLKRTIFSAGAAILCLYALVGASILLKPHQTATSAASEPIKQDPTLLADAKQLGIDVSGINLSFADDLPQADVRQGRTLGYFTPPNTIQIRRGTAKTMEVKLVAYEYLHYAWQSHTPTEKASLNAIFTDYETKTPLFAKFMNDYFAGDQTVMDDERHSNLCSMVAPDNLPEQINDYCNIEIPNRSILF